MASTVVEEKAEDGWQFDGQMRGEALKRRQVHRLIQQGGELVEQTAPSDCGTVAGHIACGATVTHVERVL